MKKRLLLTVFAMLSVHWALTQSRIITGTIKDKDSGEALTGVAVVPQSTNKGVFSDAGGKYSVAVTGNDEVLIFNFVGYILQRITVGTQTMIDVSLESNLELDEVVITAIGISREKKALGFSAQEVGGRELTNARETNLVNSLSSKVAGLQVNSSSGAAGASAFLVIRGQNTILGNNQPLFVVDGIPIDNSQLSSSNPNNGRNGYLESAIQLRFIASPLY